MTSATAPLAVDLALPVALDAPTLPAADLAAGTTIAAVTVGRARLVVARARVVISLTVRVVEARRAPSTLATRRR